MTEESTNWQDNHEVKHTDPNLNDAFIDYLADCYPDVMWSQTYIHWHSSVSEYCVYINNKWVDYVPEEYIFKAGFEHYKLWKDEWERSHQIETSMDLTRNYVQTCIEFCKEKGSVQSDYMDYVRYFASTVQNRVMSTEDQIFAVTRLLEWMERNSYEQGKVYLEELINELEQQPNKRHIRQGRSKV